MGRAWSPPAICPGGGWTGPCPARCGDATTVRGQFAGAEQEPQPEETAPWCAAGGVDAALASTQAPCWPQSVIYSPQSSSSSAMETRYTSVMRSTRSGNYYNVPLAPEVLGQAELATADSLVEEAAAAAWGTSTVRRMTTPARKADLNASLEIPIEMAGGRQHFRPAFAFDVNSLVATLHRSASDSSLSSSFGSSRGPNASFGPRETVIMSVETTQPRRGRRGAVGGESELSKSRGPVPPAPAENSIIAYSLNKKKQRKLAAAALAASAINRNAPPSLEYVGVESARGGYPSPYAPQYSQAPLQSPSSMAAPVTRNREPSIYTESFAF